MNLVLVHGFLGSSLNWSPTVARLMKDSDFAHIDFCSVDLLWHMRRHGPTEPASWNLDTLVRDFEAQVPKGNFVALGHSFGLRPLLRFSELYTGRITALISEDCAPEVSPNGFSFIRRILCDVPVPFSSRIEAKQYFDTHFESSSPMSRFLLSNIGETAPGIHGWRFQTDALLHILEETSHHNQWKAWENFDAPIHLIVGDKSSFVSNEKQLEALSRRQGRKTYLDKIPLAGHWVHSDQPDAFCQTLSKILKKYL